MKLFRSTGGAVLQNSHLARQIAACVIGAAMIATPAFAHQTFLLSEKFEYSDNETVSVSLTSALSFPNMEHGPAKDRIAFSYAAIGGEPITDMTFEESETALKISLTTDKTGFAVVAMSSKPRAGEIPPEDVDIYLDEIEADDGVRAAFDTLPGEPPLQRSYAKHAKTFVCIMTCRDATDLESPVGQKLEFVVTATGGNSFQLLLDGRPLAGKQVAISSIESEALAAETDENGMFGVSDNVSGVVMLSAVWITLPDRPDGVYHSDYATLTIDLNQLP